MSIPRSFAQKALGDTHGHVVIVVKGQLAYGKYPIAYWSSQNPKTGGDGGRGTTINRSFSAEDRDKVIYACLHLALTAPP